MTVAAPKLLSCAACGRRYKIATFDAARTYKCKEDSGILMPVDDPAPAARIGRQELTLKGETAKKVWEIPVRSGRYIVEGELGRGAMGVVYKAHQAGLNRRVALKMMLGAEVSGPDAFARFEREARAAGKLKHPNIVPIHEVGTYKDTPFFTMDLIDGRSLDKVLSDDGMMPFKKVAALMSKICAATHHAHQKGIIHRDLKPANILIDKAGEPHLTDFGLAKDLLGGGESMLSMTGDVMGTPGYMSPEQAEGNVHDLDARTDVYALGAILYKLLLNKAPHEGPTVASTLFKVVNEYAVDPRRLNKEIPEDLSAICMKAMDKERDKRYLTAGLLAGDLEAFTRGRPVTARPLTRQEMMARRLRKHKIAALVTASALLVAGAAVGSFILLRPTWLEVMDEQLQSASPEVRKQGFMSLMAKLVEADAAERPAAATLAAGYALTSEDVDVRRRILVHVQRGEAPGEFLALLSGWLKLEDPPDLCVDSIRSLAQVKYRDALPGIRTCLHSTNKEIVRASIAAFLEMPDLAAIRPLAHLAADPELGPEARKSLRRCTRVLDHLSFMTTAPDSSISESIGTLTGKLAHVNNQAEEILKEMNPQSNPVDDAIEVLKSGKGEEQVAACVYLGEARPAKAVDALMTVIAKGETQVAPVAADALVKIGAAPQKDALVALLASPEAGARAAAAYALGALGDTSVLQTLKERVPQESDARVGSILLDAIKKLGS